MNDAGKQHKKAWEYDAYHFWVEHNGTPEERAKEARARHAFQLNSYAAACEEDGIKVAHKLLYLVSYGEFVEV